MLSCVLGEQSGIDFLVGMLKSVGSFCQRISGGLQWCAR